MLCRHNTIPTLFDLLNNNRFPFTFKLDSSRLAVFDSIRFFAVRTFLLNLSLCRLLLDDFGNLARLANTLDLWKMLILFDQSLTVLNRSLFSRRSLPKLFTRMGLPYSNVGIVRSTENKLVIQCSVL